MAVNLPSYSTSYYKYNKNGGSWWAPYDNIKLPIGYIDSSNNYRCYFQVPAGLIPDGAILTSCQLTFKREDDYATKIWDIGLMNSTPSQTVSTANFAATIANDYSTTKETQHTINITPSAWGDPTAAKYIVFLGYNTSSNSYGQLYCTSSNAPHVIIEYVQGTMFYGTGGVWQRCLVYFGADGAWKQVIPYYGADSAWKQIGG